MSSTKTLPIPLIEADHRQVLRLFQQALRQHTHIDWHTLEEWLSHPACRCWVLQSSGSIRSLLGATVHTPPEGMGLPTAWLRFAVSSGLFQRDPDLDVLWEALLDDLRAAGVSLVGLLASDRWIEEPAAGWGFKRTNAVVTLRRTQGEVPPPPKPPLSIREATQADLDAIVKVDAAAFEPIWQYDRDTFEVASREAATFTVLECEGHILGYQLSTRYMGSAHLARLAVAPEEQGRGLGALLIGEMLRFFAGWHVGLFTVNTQEDNLRSRRLYTRLGFEPTGESVPVWTLAL